MHDEPQRLGARETPLARLRRRLAGPELGAVLLRGGGGALAVSLAGTGLGLGCHLLLARWLGEAAYGVYAYLLTWIGILALLSRLGFETALVRFLPKYRVEGRADLARGLLRRADRLCLLAALAIAGTAGAVLAVLAPRLDPALVGAGWVALAAIPPLALIGVRKGALQGLGRVVWAQVPDALLRPALVAVAAALAWLVAGRAGAALAMALTVGAWLVALALAWLGQRRALVAGSLAGAGVEISDRTREWLRVSLPLLLVSGMRQLLNQTDVLLVGALLGPTEAGIYFVAARLTHLISFGLVASNAVASPLISATHAAGRQGELQRLVTLSAWGASGFALLVALSLLLLRAPLLALFGDAFVAGGAVLAVLAAGQVVNALTGPVGQLLNMTGHQDANARILAVITLANLALSAPAILWLGSLGAALVTSTLVATKNLWTWSLVRRRLGIDSSILALGS